MVSEIIMSTELLQICKYGESVLAERASEITTMDDRLRNLVELMRLTMYQANGVGLAAPQVGKSVRLFMYDMSVGENPADFHVYFNPVILESDGSDTDEEGCLSVPGVNLGVERKTRLLLRAVDIDGKEFEQEYHDYEARILQHEIDHLDGRVIVDRVSPLKRRLARREITRMKQNGSW